MSAGRPHPVAARLVRAALLLFPADFRTDWGASVEETLLDRLDSEAGGPLSTPGIVARTLIGLVAAAPGVWLDRASHRRSLTPAPRRRESFAMDVLLQDLRFAVRSLARRPGFALVAVATLALGIGANTAMFSVVNGVLLRPLPYPEPDQLHMIWQTSLDDPDERSVMSRPDIDDIAELAPIAAIAGYSTSTMTMAGDEGAELVQAARVTTPLLELFDVEPVLGRDLTTDETTPEGPHRVVLGWDLWQRRFGGRADVLGQVVDLAEVPYEVVGVAPRGFEYPSATELWIAERNAGAPGGCGRGCHTLRAVARLAPGATLASATAALDALAPRLTEQYPDSNTGKRFRAEGLAAYTVGDVRTGLLLVLGAVGLVLLIACANVANLLLARSATRATEMSVRAALGAGRGRLGSQMLVESAVLSGAGAVAGVGIAWATVSGLREMARDAVPRIDEVAIDGSVLMYAAGIAVVVAVLFGLLPALNAARSSGLTGLVAGNRGGTLGGRTRSRRMLVAAEVGLSLVLLVGAGLLMRSFQRLYAEELGYDADHVARFRVVLPDSRYEELEPTVTFFSQLEARLAALPGVEHVGSSFGAPLAPGRATVGVIVDGRPEPAPGEAEEAEARPMTPGFLDAIGVPLIRGRALTAADDRSSTPVALVNETFARTVFPGEEAIGRRVHLTVDFGYGDWDGELEPMWEIVGIVGDVRTAGPRTPAEPGVYMPVAQFGPGFLHVHLRTAPGLTAGVFAPAREILRTLDPDVPMRQPETLRESVDEETAVTRFYLTLMSLFAALAVVLASVGLYGVVSYLVSRRQREVGIRMALGATGDEVTRLLVKEGLAPSLWGLLVGVLVVLAGGRVLEGVLFGVEPSDPWVIAGVTLLLLVVVSVATTIPAHRASRMHPTVALRSE